MTDIEKKEVKLSELKPDDEIRCEYHGWIWSCSAAELIAEIKGESYNAAIGTLVTRAWYLCEPMKPINKPKAVSYVTDSVWEEMDEEMEELALQYKDSLKELQAKLDEVFDKRWVALDIKSYSDDVEVQIDMKLESKEN